MKKAMDFDVLQECLKAIDHGDWHEITNTQLRMLHKRYSTIAEATRGMDLYALVCFDAWMTSSA